VTPASDHKPTKRLMTSSWGELVVELKESVLVIRPKGSRSNGPVEVAVRVGSIYQRALEQKILMARMEKRRSRKPLGKKGRRKGVS
jgi:hypothetical protein